MRLSKKQKQQLMEDAFSEFTQLWAKRQKCIDADARAREKHAKTTRAYTVADAKAQQAYGRYALLKEMALEQGAFNQKKGS